MAFGIWANDPNASNTHKWLAVSFALTHCLVKDELWNCFSSLIQILDFMVVRKLNESLSVSQHWTICNQHATGRWSSNGLPVRIFWIVRQKNYQQSFYSNHFQLLVVSFIIFGEVTEASNVWNPKTTNVFKAEPCLFMGQCKYIRGRDSWTEG